MKKYVPVPFRQASNPPYTHKINTLQAREIKTRATGGLTPTKYFALDEVKLFYAGTVTMVGSLSLDHRRLMCGCGSHKELVHSRPFLVEN